MCIIGVDIGGMSVKVGLVDENGKILSKNKKVTESTSDKVISGIVEQINDLLKEFNIDVKDLKGIGIGCPGLVKSKLGIVASNCNMGWNNVNIVEELKKYFDTNIKVSNDANVAALGETIFGCAKDYNDAIMLTLGTGVGGGIVVDKKLFEGGESLGAELGHITLINDGYPCNCGRKGCLETYASATALIRQTKDEMTKNRESLMWSFVDNDIEKVDGRTAFECSKQGDKSAIKVVDKFVEYLSNGIMSLHNIFRPEAFIIGGGLSGQGKYLTEKIADYCKKYNYGYNSAPSTVILTATLGNDAGIIGAASLVY